jgi:SAM-dependent methyltransferase
MLLVDVIKSIFKKSASGEIQLGSGTDSRNSVLNVGGGNKTIQIPEHYQNWRHLLLDIDPGGDADIVMDARKLKTLPMGQFDAVYCSHNLEHYFRHDVASVLSGFFHVLKPDGFAEIHVPNMRNVLKRFVETGMEIDDILYESPSGPISVLDVIYGWGKQIESTGVDFYAHKTGFTETSLMAALNAAGFVHVWIAESTDAFSVGALAFKKYPNPSQFALLGLSPA